MSRRIFLTVHQMNQSSFVPILPKLHTITIKCKTRSGEIFYVACWLLTVIKSCVTNLLETFDYIGRILDNGNQVDTIYLDVSKAFDRISYRKLITKLKDCSIGGSLLICGSSRTYLAVVSV